MESAVIGVLLSIGIAAVGIGLVLWWVVHRARQRAPVIQAVAEACGGRGQGDRFEGTWEGIAYRGEYRPGSEEERPNLRLGVSCGAKGDVSIVKRGGLQALLGRLRPGQDVRTGDPLFDRDFAVRAKPPTWAKRCLGDATKRDAVRRLFHLGCARVTLDQREWRAEWAAFDLKRLRPELLREAVPHLAALGS